jgi:hypothetical protein
VLGDEESKEKKLIKSMVEIISYACSFLNY